MPLNWVWWLQVRNSLSHFSSYDFTVNYHHGLGLHHLAHPFPHCMCHSSILITWTSSLMTWGCMDLEDPWQGVGVHTKWKIAKTNDQYNHFIHITGFSHVLVWNVRNILSLRTPPTWIFKRSNPQEDCPSLSLLDARFRQCLKGQCWLLYCHDWGQSLDTFPHEELHRNVWRLAASDLWLYDYYSTDTHTAIFPFGWPSG